jgi:ADP-ribosylglycohydrolase/fructose-1,6-bisphosphatase/inositol monophosphatase family enzyme
VGYEREFQVAIEAAKEAGALLLRDFHRPGGPRGAGAHADADLEAEKVIREKLLAATKWSYLGEETGRATGEDERHVWLVDPNDGTASYLRGLRGSAVSIAALRDGQPILGVVFAFAFPDDRGDLIAWAEGCGSVTRNGIPVVASLAHKALDRNSVVLVSQDADRNSAANAACVAPARFAAIPSIAYRLALVSVGAGVAAVSLAGPGGWDYAAGDALVRAQGGVLADAAGRPITYTRDGHSGSGGRCFGGAPRAVAELVQRQWDQVFARSTETEPTYALAHLERGRAVEDVEILSRAQGCLLGTFSGDALGSLVEFGRSDGIRATYPNGVRDLADGGAFNTIAGQATDDSELGLMLARSLVQENGFEPGAVLDAYVHWYRSGPFDCGNTTGLALRTAATGKTRAERVRRAAEVASKTSQANGSLMRIAPLGVFGWRAPAAAARWAREDSALTHPHSTCAESCAAFVAAIATAIGQKATAPVVHEAALTEARRGGDRAVIDALTKAEQSTPERFDGSDSGWVLLALQNAFYQLLHAVNLEEGIVATIAGGGDTDTTAAIAGALLGAVHGRDAVPVRWRRPVLTCRPLPEVGAVHPRPREFWPVDALALAERLLLAGAPTEHGDPSDPR